MKRFFVFIFWVILIWWFGSTFWYFENKVYCNIKDNNVTISLMNYSWTLKCKVYIDVIQQNALKKYDEIMAINSYIAQWEDVYYWKNVLESKKSDFLQLVNYRSQIISVVNRFESVLFNRYYDSLQKDMRIYYSDLEVQYYSLINQDTQVKWSKKELMISQLKQQIENVSAIIEAESLDDIMKIVPSYIYLKKQIEWN